MKYFEIKVKDNDRYRVVSKVEHLEDAYDIVDAIPDENVIIYDILSEEVIYHDGNF